VTPVVEFLAVLALSLALFAPVGYAILGLRGGRIERSDLGLAVCLGYAVVPALLLAELHLGAPLFVLPAAGAAALLLGRRWRELARPGSWGPLAPALLAASLVLWVNGPDVATSGGEVRFRQGWDVSDRTFYATVASAARRAPPPATENPLFAGVPAPGSYFPALLALLQSHYAGVSSIRAAMVHVPALGLFLLALVADRLLAEAFSASSRARLLTLLLLVLGGDLSWLLPATGDAGIERTRHFFVFHSWSAQALLINAWGLGLPVAMALLLALRRFLAHGGGRLALALFLLAGALFETRIFAIAPILAGAAVVAVTGARRSGWAVLASAAGCLPGLALTLSFPGAGEPPFRLLPWAVARRFLYDFPQVQAALGVLPDAFAWHAALAVGIVLVVLGGLGVRLAGIVRLARECGGAQASFHRMLAASLAIALGAGLLLIGHPLPADAAQFLTWAQFASWLYAGPALGALAPRRPSVVVAACVAALVAPAYYVGAKAVPRWLTSGAADRAVDVIDRDTVSACLWLGSKAGRNDRLSVPVFTPADPSGGARGIRVALLSGLALVGSELPFAVTDGERLSRLRDLRGLYSSREAAAAEEILERRLVRWVWVDRNWPLAFTSPRLRLRFQNGGVLLYEFVATKFVASDNFGSESPLDTST
jgi:hypothetical protein